MVKKSIRVRDFMDDPEGKGKINRAVNSDFVGSAAMGFYPASHTRLFSASFQYVQHPLLKIDCKDTALITDESCEAYGKEPHPAANIHYGHALFYIWTQDLLRPVKEVAETIIECVCKPPWAYMGFHRI